MTYAPITVLARRALLDALDALTVQRDALVLAGAQAIYLYTGDADVAIATQTKDSDLVLVPSRLTDDPRLEEAMRSGGFRTIRAGSSQASGPPDRTSRPSSCWYLKRCMPGAAAAAHESRPTPSIPPVSSPD